ncbi:MAG TPA: hypothetical protein VFG95_01095, partial [Nitrospiria bacterium]|nr:hypothetical protein [Nitrospiria bacterium]
GGAEQIEEQNHEEAHHDPKGEILDAGIHRLKPPGSTELSKILTHFFCADNNYLLNPTKRKGRSSP